MTAALGAEICNPVLKIAKDMASRGLERANEALEAYDDEDSDDEDVSKRSKAKDYKEKLFKACRTRNACNDDNQMVGTALRVVSNMASDGNGDDRARSWELSRCPPDFEWSRSRPQLGEVRFRMVQKWRVWDSIRDTASSLRSGYACESLT